MDKEEFRAIIHNTLLLNRFIKKKTFYYRENEDVKFVLYLQRSSYSACYYINIGIVIKTLHPELTFPRDVDGDVRMRFYFDLNGKRIDCLPIDELSDPEVLVAYLLENIKRVIVPIEEKGLAQFLKDNPVYLHQTQYDAKKLMGFEVES